MSTSFNTNEDYPDDPDLPLGIFPEAHPESCRHALRQQGLPCTRLNAELFYEMGQIQRNRLVGCSTEELRDIDLWDQLSGLSLWDEPLTHPERRLITPEESLDNFNRQARWEHVERFLKRVHEWCLYGAAPEIVPYCNRRGQETWRFRKLTWTEDGIAPAKSAQPPIPSKPIQILHAAWNYLFWSRRRWLKAHPRKVWLAEQRLHLIREAFKALLNRFAVPRSDWPDIKEEPKLSWPHSLEDKLTKLEDRERRALERLQQLQRSGNLTSMKLRLALDFLEDLAEDIDLTQRRLDEAIVKLARNNGYDEVYWGTTLEKCYLSPDELQELREEMRMVVTEEAQASPPDEPLRDAPIFHHPPQPGQIKLTPAA
jgi:hypothetical protein